MSSVSPALEILPDSAQSAAGASLRRRRDHFARNVEICPFGDQKFQIQRQVANKRAVVGESARGKADTNGHTHVTRKFREGQI